MNSPNPLWKSRELQMRQSIELFQSHQFKISGRYSMGNDCRYILAPPYHHGSTRNFIPLS